ncbi:MAG: sigma-70 family RNA polymerase sigma factor [Planctomycetota bacterium]
MTIQPRLRAYIRMLIYNPSDVNDIMQDVTAIGLEKFSTLDKSESFDSWILGIARLRVYEYVRQKKRRPVQLNDEAIEVLTIESETNKAFASDLQDYLETCLGKLSSNDYQLVQKRFNEVRTNRDLSKSLGLSESAVSRALSRIYAQLLLCIKRQQRTLGVRG